jgi:hypothetical protein
VHCEVVASTFKIESRPSTMLPLSLYLTWYEAHRGRGAARIGTSGGRVHGSSWPGAGAAAASGRWGAPVAGVILALSPARRTTLTCPTSPRYY